MMKERATSESNSDSDSVIRVSDLHFIWLEHLLRELPISS